MDMLLGLLLGVPLTVSFALASHAAAEYGRARGVVASHKEKQEDRSP